MLKYKVTVTVGQMEKRGGKKQLGLKYKTRSWVFANTT